MRHLTYLATDTRFANPRRHFFLQKAGCSVAAALAAPLRTLMVFPVTLLLVTLTVMLLRPPDLEYFSVDRIAFLVLVTGVVLRTLTLRRTFPRYGLTWPMAGLAALTVAGALGQPYEAKTWSVLAAKFIVPFALFHLAGLIFEGDEALRSLDQFTLLVLLYLSFTAIVFLLGAHALVFPRFILDPTLGIHADRARGPFLQAVANGVTLNLLGLIAIDRYRCGRLKGVWAFVLLGSLPLAIAATKTRGVWLSFGASLIWLCFRTSDFERTSKFRGILLAGILGLFAVLWLNRASDFEDRLQESSPVEFRMAAYRAGLGMFLERPFAGWGTSQLQSELARRIRGFQGDTFVVHNTYLEILIEDGVVGFALYLWIVVGLARLGRLRRHPGPTGFTGTLVRVWPALLGVYLINALFVVMNYQFVNALLFTFAGILAAWRRREEHEEELDAS